MLRLRLISFPRSLQHRLLTAARPFSTHTHTDKLNGNVNGHHALNSSSLPVDTEWISAESPNVAVDLQVLRPGDTLDIPYELTVTDTFADLWHSAFLSQDRLQTSTPYARKLGFQDRVLPFGLVAFLCSTMTHADAAKIQVGYGNIHYHWPGFVGDTFTKNFKVMSVRNTSDGQHSIIQFQCNLWNQRGRLCMQADKRMLFEARVVESRPHSVPQEDDLEKPEQLLRNHLLSKAAILHRDSHSLVHLRQGQLLRHTHARSLAVGTCQQLASLGRLTHPRHFVGNNKLVPGGLVVGLCQSATARELHEVLYEEVLRVQFCNEVHPDTTVVGALSYISNIVPVAGGDLQWLTVRTIGIDVATADVPDSLPRALLEKAELLLPKELEEYCRRNCPELCGRIVLQMDRQILRQATSKPDDVFLL